MDKYKRHIWAHKNVSVLYSTKFRNRHIILYILFPYGKQYGGSLKTKIRATI